MRGFWMIAAVAGCVLADAPARSATVESFDFTQTGWGVADITAEGLTVGASDPGGVLTGRFTGTVEPDGLILLGDLTAFFDSYSDSASKGILGMGLADLTAFAYDTKGGPGGLDIAGAFGKDQTCEGNAVPTTPDCNGSGSVVYTSGIDGAIFKAGLPLPSLLTVEEPVVSNAGATPAVREPSALALLLASSAALGFAGRSRRRRAA